MTREEQIRAVLGLKPGEKAREYEAGEIIPVPGPKADGTDFPGPDDDCTMGAPVWADSEPVKKFRRSE